MAGQQREQSDVEPCVCCVVYDNQMAVVVHALLVQCAAGPWMWPQQHGSTAENKQCVMMLLSPRPSPGTSCKQAVNQSTRPAAAAPRPSGEHLAISELTRPASSSHLLGLGEATGDRMGSWPGGSTGPPVMMRLAISAPTKASPAQQTAQYSTVLYSGWLRGTRLATKALSSPWA
jgi:hypothetical protein